MNLELSYQTQNLPAPYAFSAIFNIEISSNKVAVDFNLEYLDRDEISEAEILAEGYSLDDGFVWKGVLGFNWVSVIESLQNIKVLDQPKEGFYLHISREGKSGYPDLPDDVMIQELLQGVFEAAEREAPLTVQFYQNSQKTHVTWEFANRKVQMDGAELSWETGYTLMQTLYAFDMDEAKPLKKPTEQSISFDGKNWFSVKKPELWKLVTN